MRLVNADVILAAAQAVLSVDPKMHAAARASVMEHRTRAIIAHLTRQSIDVDVVRLAERIERFAEHWTSNAQNSDTVHSLVRMVDDPETGERVPETNEITVDDLARIVSALRTLTGDLDDATQAGDEGARVTTPGEFAARWNALDAAQRMDWLLMLEESADRSMRCVIEDHAGLRDRASSLGRQLLALQHHVDLDDMHDVDALPDGSVVIDRDGDVWQYRGGLWCSYETKPYGSEGLTRKFGPLRLLQVGGE